MGTGIKYWNNPVSRQDMIPLVFFQQSTESELK